jgi:hypothetical protein
MEDPILAELNRQKQAAWDAHDRGRLDLYLSIEREITKMRAVARALLILYKNTHDDDAWNALFEASVDAGLLNVEEDSADA